MIRLLRHLAYEGPRHAGRVTTRRVTPPPFYELHTPLRLGFGGRQHIVTTPAGWEALAGISADDPGLLRTISPDLGAHLLGIPVYVDTCPCNPSDRCVPPATTPTTTDPADDTTPAPPTSRATPARGTSALTCHFPSHRATPARVDLGGTS